jgi:nucleoside 2-deoxyribosyltransferase
MTTSRQCPVCLGTTTPFEIRPQSSVACEISCENCGKYITTYEFVSNPPATLAPEDRALLSGWIRDKGERESDAPLILLDDVIAILASIPRPAPTEKAFKLLLSLARMSGDIPGKQIDRMKVRPSDAWAINLSEVGTYAEWLAAKKYIFPYAENGLYRLTLDGWAEVERLKHQTLITGRRAFVAMSFAADMDETYTQGLEPGVRDADYEPFRLKEAHHTERIDARIIAELRACRLVVADVTGNRSAVYYEAGFAEGLGKKVIWTCREDRHKDDMCFDTRQFPHILWNEYEDLRTQLRDRIRAVVV